MYTRMAQEGDATSAQHANDARMAQEGDAISAKLANDATGRSPG